MAVSVEEINDARNLNGKGAADKKKVQLDALYTESVIAKIWGVAAKALHTAS